MGWSEKYKRSINCDNPKGFSQKAHCQGRKKKISEQMKPYKSVEEIAKKHRLEVSFIQRQLDMGEPIEHEHTKNHELAREIALQHLDEIPDYYTRLKKMEAQSKKHHKKFKDVKEAVYESRRDNKRAGDPGYSLRDWFKGGGWVQVAGKYKGKPCAKQPGQKTKPFCRDADDAAAMSKAEKERRTSKKRQEDPNPERRGKAKMVREDTCPICNCDPCQCLEGTLQEKKDACYHKVKSRYKVWPSAYASGALVKCRKVGADNWGTKSESVGETRYCPACKKYETKEECKFGPRYWEMFGQAINPPEMLTTNQMKYSIAQVHPANEEKDHEYSMARSEISTIIAAAKRLKKKMGKGEGNIEAWVQSKITKAADYIDAAADYVDSGEMSEEISPTIPGGRSPYKYPTLPKEDPDDVPIRLIKGKEPKLPLAKKETKTQVAHYEPEGEQLDELAPLVAGGLALGAGALGLAAIRRAQQASKSGVEAAKKGQKIQPGTGIGQASYGMQRHADATREAMKLLRQETEVEGELIDEAGKKCWAGYEKKGTQKLFGKTYNRCVKKEQFSNWREELAEDWQKVNRQDKTDGLSQAAVDAYRRENPGSKLQTAVTEKKPTGKRAKRRANFCRRMKGMKSKLTSAKTARDPDSRINKALRRWNCN